MSQQQDERITTEIFDVPHVKGRRITVTTIYDRVEGRGLDPQTVADRLELDVADVYRALAYYHDNPDRMEEARELEREAAEEIERRAEKHKPSDVR